MKKECIEKIWVHPVKIWVHKVPEILKGGKSTCISTSKLRMQIKPTMVSVYSTYLGFKTLVYVHCIVD